MSIAAHLLIVAGPSGAGKSTLVRALLERHNPQLTLSISYTTRALRGRERDGLDYHFVDRPAFEALRDTHALAEWAEVHGNLYGTARAPLEDAAQLGRDTIFDVDVQGTQSLRAAYPGAWSVLVAPPSLDVLEARLRGRKTDAEPVIQRRLERARWELSQTQHFDFVIVNDTLDASVAALDAIYAAMRQRVDRVRAAALH